MSEGKGNIRDAGCESGLITWMDGGVAAWNGKT